MDKVKSLSNKTLTGGRLNAYRAVAATAAGSPPAVTAFAGGSSATFSASPVAAGQGDVLLLGVPLTGVAIRPQAEPLAAASVAEDVLA